MNKEFLKKILANKKDIPDNYRLFIATCIMAPDERDKDNIAKLDLLLNIKHRIDYNLPLYRNDLNFYRANVGMSEEDYEKFMERVII